MEAQIKNPALIFCLSVILSALMFTSVVSAQELPPQQSERSLGYSDDELVEFIFVAHKVMPLQQESQMKMIQEIEEQELTIDKFNNILEAQTNGKELNATQEEIDAFNNAIENIQLIQEQYMALITEVIIDEGMTPERYEEIIFNYQQDPQLQLRINQLMDDINNNQ
jgi:hypothetical protein